MTDELLKYFQSDVYLTEATAFKTFQIQLKQMFPFFSISALVQAA